MEIMLTF